MDSGTTKAQLSRQSSSNLLQTNESSVLARTAVTLEYASLINAGHCPLGIYVVPSSSNLLVWDGVFFVHQGLFNSLPYSRPL